MNFRVPALFYVWWQTLLWRPVFGFEARLESLLSPTDAANVTVSVASIPSDFHVYRVAGVPIPWLPEACFINIIAVLHKAALGNFKGKEPIANYRTPRFPEPLIKIGVPQASSDLIPREFLVWGLFLTSFDLQLHNQFTLSFYDLMWKGKDVGGISVGKFPKAETEVQDLRTLSNRGLSIDFEYYGDRDIGKNAIFITIIGAMTTAAPPAAKTSIRETWVSYLKDQPCIFVIVPTAAARTASPRSLLYEDLIYILAISADHFAENNKYQALSMNISIDKVKVAQAAFSFRSEYGSISNGSAANASVR